MNNNTTLDIYKSDCVFLQKKLAIELTIFLERSMTMKPDSQIHLGHRERMRRKLIAYGAEIFDTYELLEMLLYSVIPLRDTNPIAKRLLMTFGSLDGVLSASAEELMTVDGVGATTASYLATVGALPLMLSNLAPTVRSLADYDEIGKYLVRYYEDRTDYAVSMLLLDNAMRPMRVVDVYYCDYGKGSVQCKPFLDIAISLGAGCAVLFHNHPYGPLYPSHSDLLTHKILADGFKRSGITLLDHYLISGKGYIRIGKMATEANGVDRLLDEFGIVCIKSQVLLEDTDMDDPAASCSTYLENYLGYSISSSEKQRKTVTDLMERYHSVDGILSRDADELSEICGDAAVKFKLLAYVTSRRYTDKYRPGTKLGEWITDYFKWYFFGASVETVSLMLFDKNRKLVTVHKISEGTVNTSEIIPRRAMEAAAKAKAACAVMAHNHPGGTCEASASDVHATMVVDKALESIGVKLLGHYVVAGMGIGMVELPDSIQTT